MISSRAMAFLENVDILLFANNIQGDFSEHVSHSNVPNNAH